MLIAETQKNEMKRRTSSGRYTYCIWSEYYAEKIARNKQQTAHQTTAGVREGKAS